MLRFVANKLGELCQDLVFLGGCTTGLLITDEYSPDVRYTLDVDCIVDVISLNRYYLLEKQLRERGFNKLLTDEIICRWHCEDVILDVMPTDEKILGFGNIWYKEAIQQSILYSLGSELDIKIVTAPFFLATKLEAFKSRGKYDFYSSHDFEDLVSVMDGRIEILADIENTTYELKHYLAQTFIEIHKSRAFHDALPSHFIHYGVLANDRITLFLKKMKAVMDGFIPKTTTP